MKQGGVYTAFVIIIVLIKSVQLLASSLYIRVVGGWIKFVQIIILSLFGKHAKQNIGTFENRKKKKRIKGVHMAI